MHHCNNNIDKLCNQQADYTARCCYFTADSCSLCQRRSRHRTSTVYHGQFSCLALRLLFFFHGRQRNSVSHQREAEGCARMLLGNDSFSVPTQPADRQRDTIAALRATVRPHTQALYCWALQLGPWHTCEEIGQVLISVCKSFDRAAESTLSVVCASVILILSRCSFCLEYLSTNARLSQIYGLMVGVTSPEKGLVHSESHLLSLLYIWLFLHCLCSSAAFPSLTSAALFSTSFTMQKTSRSISVQRCIVKGWSPCSVSAFISHREAHWVFHTVSDCEHLWTFKIYFSLIT